MNFLDIIIIIVNVIIIFIGIGFMMFSLVDGYDLEEKLDEMFFSLVVTIFILSVTFLLPFLVIDKSSGNSIGTITSVDKNFFGTTALYIKITETNEEKYCIEFDEELENQAKELIGQKVKISYGKRVGLYSTSKCRKAPVEEIELID